VQLPQISSLTVLNSLQNRRLVNRTVILYFLNKVVVSPLTNSRIRRPPLVSCTRLLIQYGRTSLIRMLVNRIANYLDRLGPSWKFVENFTKL